MKKPLDKQNKVCYNEYTKSKRETKNTTKKSLKKIKKVLDKKNKVWYNEYVIKRGNLLDK